MAGKWHGGKGDSPRKSLRSSEEKDLRWELAFGRPTAERKEYILALLAEKGGKDDK